MAMANARRLVFSSHRTPFLVSTTSTPASFIQVLPRFFSKSSRYGAKVGILEFLNGIEEKIGDFEKLRRLKKLDIPCKDRKLIFKYANKYRLGLWRPRADLVKAESAKS